MKHSSELRLNDLGLIKVLNSSLKDTQKRSMLLEAPSCQPHH